MNILITLPKELIAKIISGDKVYEMRKCRPKNLKVGLDGFFVVEKGTDNVRCWCRVDKIKATTSLALVKTVFPPLLCVDGQYIEKYANNKKLYLWKIGKVISFDKLRRCDLFVDRNPQSFSYCPFSSGRKF